jgi:hypothetical protein
MKWITALDLEQWANTLGARDAFPSLVGDLIRASAKDIDGYRFPSGDKGQVRGFDGSLVASAAPPFIPGGSSIWEFGASEGAAAKAEKDYAKRVKETPQADRATMTFVFVSPRTWDNPKEKLDDWIKKKKAQNDWADVKYIDGVGVEAWLDDHPAVAARYSRFELGRYPHLGARSTDEFWEEYSTRFKPSLTEEVLLCDREKQAQELLPKLAQNSGDVILAADSPDEVIAFTVAAIRKATPDVRLFLEARTLIIDHEDVATLFAGKPGLTFLPRAQARHVAGLLAKAGPTLVAIGGDQPNRKYDVLTRPSTSSLSKAISTMGFPEEKGQELARSCGRSVTKEIRRADIDREELIEVLDRRFLDSRSFRDPCIGDKDVQAISDDAACLLGKLAGAVSGGEVRRYGICAATGFAYLGDNTVGFIRAAAVVHENLGTGRGERKRTGAAHATRSASNESGFACQSRHDHHPCCCCGGVPAKSNVMEVMRPGTARCAAQTARDIETATRDWRRGVRDVLLAGEPWI